MVPTWSPVNVTAGPGNAGNLTALGSINCDNYGQITPTTLVLVGSFRHLAIGVLRPAITSRQFVGTVIDRRVPGDCGRPGNEHDRYCAGGDDRTG